MTKQITRQQLSAALVERHGQERQQHLYTASVGIAGLGGLGSNIAVQLTRLGIGHLTLADCDRVEISNLNRQSYRLCDIGRPKPEALTEQLLQINPYLCYEPHFLKLTPQNIPEIFAGCNIICEAFDDPEQKAMLTETVLQRLPQAKLIVCSGMAGAGSANAITTSRRLNRFYLCGDGVSEGHRGNGLTAARVAICAGQQALMAARLILGREEP